MIGRIYGGSLAAPSWEGARPGNQPAKPKRRILLTSANVVQQTPVEKEKSLLQKERINLGDQHMAMIDDPALLGRLAGKEGGSKGTDTQYKAWDNMSAHILAAHRQDDDLQKLYAEQRKAARKPSKKKCVLTPYSKLKKGELVEKIADNLPLSMMIRKSELQKMTVKDLRTLAARFCKTGSVKGGDIEYDNYHGPLNTYDSRKREQQAERWKLGIDDVNSVFYGRPNAVKGKISTSVYSRPPIGGEPVRLPSDIVRYIGLFDKGFENRPKTPQKPGLWARQGDDYVPRAAAPAGSPRDYFNYEGFQFLPSNILPGTNLKPDKKVVKKKRKRDAIGGMTKN